VKHYHVISVGIFLIAAALMVGVTACDGIGSYQLAISSASGGSVTTPGHGTFTYDAGTAVQLAARPHDDYQFRLWSGDVEHIANPNTASTTITMDRDYSIVANFETKSETGPGGGDPYASLINRCGLISLIAEPVTGQPCLKRLARRAYSPPRR